MACRTDRKLEKSERSFLQKDVCWMYRINLWIEHILCVISVVKNRMVDCPILFTNIEVT